MSKDQFSPNRRRILKGGAAAAATGLTGCVTTGNPMFDGLLKQTGSQLGSQFASDAIFAAIGVPNRMAFVSGRPMSAEDKESAARIRAQFQQANVQVTEMPTDPRIFKPMAKAKPAGAIRMTSRTEGGWEGTSTVRGREQLARAKSMFDKYRNATSVSIQEAVALVEAVRPFTTALYDQEQSRSSEGRESCIVVAPNSYVVIPMRTGCLGAGLPLPSAGEGTRLVNVLAAVHPDQRPAVQGLLNYIARNDNDIYAVQHLIWKLIHADNDGYQNLFAAQISPSYRAILDQAVPGGSRRYMQLLEEAYERRKIEQKKLALANLAIGKLNEICGMSFTLIPPSGVSPSSPQYAESLLKQGKAEALKNLQSQLTGLGANMLGQSVNSMLNSAGLGQAVPLANEALRSGEQAVQESLLGPNSPFSPLQGYTELAPNVGAHITDIGGASAQVALTIVNGTTKPHYYNPASLGAITPRRTQAQSLGCDRSQLRGGRVDFKEDKSMLSEADQRIAKAQTEAFKQIAEKASIKLIDMRNERVWRARGFAAALRFTPGVGTFLGVYDIYSYFYGSGKDAFGNKIEKADVAFAALGLVPIAGNYLGVFAKAAKPVLGSSLKYVEAATDPARLSTFGTTVETLDWARTIDNHASAIGAAYRDPAANKKMETLLADVSDTLSRLGEGSVSSSLTKLGRA